MFVYYDRGVLECGVGLFPWMDIGGRNGNPVVVVMSLRATCEQKFLSLKLTVKWNEDTLRFWLTPRRVPVVCAAASYCCRLTFPACYDPIRIGQRNCESSHPVTLDITAFEYFVGLLVPDGFGT